MIVYVVVEVFSGDMGADYSEPRAVFSTREQADAYAALGVTTYTSAGVEYIGRATDVMEFTVDSPSQWEQP